MFNLFAGCKKDKLEGEKSILVGEWEWVYTEKIVDYCDPDYMYSTILNPLTENETYQIHFYQQGKVNFYKNNVVIEEYRIIFEGFGSPYECSTDNAIPFFIALDNDSKLDFDGCVSKDSLVVIRDFPYPDKDVFEPGVDCYLTTSYFVRK